MTGGLHKLWTGWPSPVQLEILLDCYILQFVENATAFNILDTHHRRQKINVRASHIYAEKYPGTQQERRIVSCYEAALILQ